MKTIFDLFEEFVENDHPFRYNEDFYKKICLLIQEAQKDAYNSAVSDSAQAIHNCDIKDKDGYRWLCKNVVNPLKKV